VAAATASLELLCARLGESLDPAHDVPAAPAGLRHAAVVAILTDAHVLGDGYVTADAASADGGSPSGGGPGIVLIERAAQLRSHAGQVAFPGGKPEPGDRDLVATALREAAEEVGLPGARTVLGRLAPVPTPSGFFVVPFVAVAPAGWRAAVASAEVGRVLQPSLARVRDPAIHRVNGHREWRGQLWELHEFALCEPPVWGATARMLFDLVQRLAGLP
jgi:8-oxo-dGTP pyrophosphatase MutT (NUDIX family)